ncbi:MAG: tRNA pseudouridine(38-40) synthase TruA [Bacteroidales bacterium]|nr:tRNA pseudouridine(38-40) synthase TruA [Bacteroidales bacterium]
MRYKIKLSYDGKAFCGWQIQNNARTVQGELEKALSTLLGTQIQVTGAGRTDSDVNAINYIAHFDVPDGVSIEAAHLCYKLNAMTAREIAVHEVSETSEDFHARFGAQSREYHYFIHFQKDPFCEKFSYRMRYPLDIEKMNQAAEYLLGEHDFSCFEKVGGNNTTSICTVTEASWSTYRPLHVEMMGYPCKDGDYIVFRICANRFLRNMVRAIVGSLIEVGRGKKDPEWIAELIESGSRSDAGSSVPGNALFFTGAVYSE